MAIRSAPKRKVDYEKLDDLQKEIFGLETEEKETPATAKAAGNVSSKTRSRSEKKTAKTVAESTKQDKAASLDSATKGKGKESENSPSIEEKSDEDISGSSASSGESLGLNLSDMETIAARITSTKAGQGRNTTRPFSLPRTLIIDTTRLKAKFRTIDEQYTQNVIVDFLVREALAVITPENYQDLKNSAFEFVKRPDETTRRSLTVTEEVVYQMSELKAGINLETGRKYSNDEIFSTLLAVGVSWLYRSGILS